MTETSNIMKSSDGALFVQVDGPNTQPRYVGCVDVDTLTEPGGAIDTLIRCFKPDGTGWQTLDSTVTPPEPVTTTITTFVEGVGNFLEDIKDAATLFIHQRAAGRADTFGNYVRTWVLTNARIGEKTASDLVMREEDNPSTMGFGISALPPVYRSFKRTTGRQSHSIAAAINDIALAGVGYKYCDDGFAVTDAIASSPSDTADVLYTRNAGSTWTAASAQPFAAAEDAVSVVAFQVGRDTTRAIVARGTTDGANPMEVAYTDDWGATWNNVDVGSVNGQYATGKRALFATGPYDIWLVTDGGYIYKSVDAGITWTAQEEGAATTEDLYAVHFINDRVGIAGGTNDTILITEDGGDSWTEMTGTGESSATINAVHILSAERAWVGTSNGKLFYTEDGGTTWSQRNFSGDGSGSVKAITFHNDSFGVMLHDTTAPVGRAFVTIDGGYTWELVNVFTNAGLNSVIACDHNTYFFAGEVSGGTGVIGKLYPSQ